MGLFRRDRSPSSGLNYRDAATLAEHLALADRMRGSTVGSQIVTTDTAMRNSGVWACLRLRGNVLSTMPVDVYREVLGIDVEVKKPPVLVNPGGEKVGIQEWLYSTQVDLDRAGNTIGLITEKDGLGKPARIDLQPISECTMRIKSGVIDEFKIGKKWYRPDVVWHEKQYTIAGLPFGLSPVAYAAWTIGEYLSIQDFATKWFSDGGKPSAILKNSKRVLDTGQTALVKSEFKQTTAAGDVFVTGSDWEYSPLVTQQASMEWLDAKRFGIADVARFFDCPGDLIDAQVSGSTVTYANIVQRNLQFLILHLGPAVTRRETALSSLLARPRFARLNTKALLRMDPETQAKVLGLQIDKRILAPSEARAILDLQPFTDSQVAEFDHFWPAKSAASPATSPTPKPQTGAV